MSDWISVSEKLPKEDERVLITTEMDEVIIAWLYGGAWHSDGGFYYGENEVLAWQPLPKPYEGGKE